MIFFTARADTHTYTISMLKRIAYPRHSQGTRQKLRCYRAWGACLPSVLWYAREFQPLETSSLGVPLLGGAFFGIEIKVAKAVDLACRGRSGMLGVRTEVRS